MVIIETKKEDVSLVVKANTELTYVALEDVNSRSFSIEENASLNYINISFNSKTDALKVNLIGDKASFKGQVLVIAKNDSYDFKQEIVHKNKNTNSNITNLAISLGNSKVSFETIGHILNKMKGSNCRQLAKGIMVSDNSEITAKPILLIDENDVYAYHGAAIGKMSDDALFYLMSRGLNKDEALKLMVEALINPVVNSLPNEIKEDISIKIEKSIKL